MKYYILITLILIFLFFHFARETTKEKESFHPKIRKFNRNIKNKGKKIVTSIYNYNKNKIINIYKLLFNKYNLH